MSTFITTTAQTGSASSGLGQNSGITIIKGNFNEPYCSPDRVPGDRADSAIIQEIDTLRDVLTKSGYEIRYIRPIFAVIDWPHQSIRDVVETYRLVRGKTADQPLTEGEQQELDILCQPLADTLRDQYAASGDASDLPSTRLPFLHDYEVKIESHRPLSWRRELRPFWKKHGGFREDDADDRVSTQAVGAQRTADG